MYPFNVPFKIISLVETSQSIGGAKRKYPGKLRAQIYSDLTHSATGAALSKLDRYVTNILKICFNKLDAKKIGSILQNN